MVANYLALFGILLYLTPTIMVYMAGARSEEDAIQYFMQFPIEKLIMLSSLPKHGYGLLMLGMCLSYLE